jgi:hypothetical protein
VELSGILVVSRKEHHKGWWGNFGFRISDLNAENAESAENVPIRNPASFFAFFAFFAVSLSTRLELNRGWTQMDADGDLSVCIGVNPWFEFMLCSLRFSDCGLAGGCDGVMG